jgi:BTB/POZ domain-containing protein 9
MTEYLLNGETDDYDMEKGFTCHPIQDSMSDGIIVELGGQSYINAMRFLLWDHDARSYCYYIEVSVDKNNWTRVVDYSEYLCRSWQHHCIKPVIVRYIRIVGTHNTVNRVFHVVSFECYYTEDILPVDDQGILIPNYNVASIKRFATVIEGISRSQNVLINGDTENYDWENGYTCHRLGEGSVVIQLAQPFILGSCRMLLWDLDDRTYNFYIEVSTDSHHWSRVVDKTEENCQSWQLMMFEPQPVTFIKIVGTGNSANEVFHCVHIEAPATVTV